MPSRSRRVVPFRGDLLEEAYLAVCPGESGQGSVCTRSKKATIGAPDLTTRNKRTLRTEHFGHRDSNGAIGREPNGALLVHVTSMLYLGTTYTWKISRSRQMVDGSGEHGGSRPIPLLGVSEDLRVFIFRQQIPQGFGRKEGLFPLEERWYFVMCCCCCCCCCCWLKLFSQGHTIPSQTLLF